MPRCTRMGIFNGKFRHEKTYFHNKNKRRISSDEAGGHAGHVDHAESRNITVISFVLSVRDGHAEHDQKYFSAKNFFTRLKMKLCVEFFFFESQAALMSYPFSFIQWFHTLTSS